MRAPLFALLAGLAIAAAPPQRPEIVRSAGAFSATRLSAAPAIDGREWVAAEAQPVNEEGAVRLAAKGFALTATDCGDHNGDFTRCRLFFQRGNRPRVRIDTDFTGWVFVTPDGRYIVTEPLDVLDVAAWKQYVLSEALNIPNYTDIRAISRDGKRLLVAWTDCPMDCRNEQRFDYYEVRLP
jgi:hypothetical protein